ncbi:MAG: hypothetical protein GY744_14655 [Gammaproteobacteria bacterium]|nr:hypothetical protein [Gammaproteobacteria bacterium]
MKAVSIFITLFFICSCGQVDDKSPNNSASTKIDDLVVSSDFDFIGGETLAIDIEYEGSPQQRLYLNICSDFIQVDGQYQVNYSSCLLRTSIQSQYKKFEIALSSNEQKLLAQVWPLVNGATPENHLWDRSEDGNNWQIIVF